jgi:hypothetical protein
LLCFFASLPRTLNQLSGLGTFSAVTMGIAVLLAIIFSGIQSEPFGFVAGEPGIVTNFPVAGTTFVIGMFKLFYSSYSLTRFSAMSAFLNISYTLIGQITIPSVLFHPDRPLLSSSLLYSVYCGDEGAERFPQRCVSNRALATFPHSSPLQALWAVTICEVVVFTLWFVLSTPLMSFPLNSVAAEALCTISLETNT